MEKLTTFANFRSKPDFRIPKFIEGEKLVIKVDWDSATWERVQKFRDVVMTVVSEPKLHDHKCKLRHPDGEIIEVPMNCLYLPSLQL